MLETKLEMFELTISDYTNGVCMLTLILKNKEEQENKGSKKEVKLTAFIDKHGSFLHPFRDAEDEARVTDDSGTYYIDRNGKLICESRRFSMGSDFSEGLASVRVKARSVSFYIDKLGREQFSGQSFVFAGSFKDGLAGVSSRGWMVCY